MILKVGLGRAKSGFGEGEQEVKQGAMQAQDASNVRVICRLRPSNQVPHYDWLRHSNARFLSFSEESRPLGKRRAQKQEPSNSYDNSYGICSYCCFRSKFAGVGKTAANY